MKEREFNSKIAVMVTRDGMGDAPQELSHTLLKNYFTLLKSENRIPAYVCFYGDGVKLVCEGSHITEEIKQLENSGAKIIICKTCLIFNNILDKVTTGTVGTMADIIDVQHNSTKVINL